MSYLAVGAAIALAVYCYTLTLPGINGILSSRCLFYISVIGIWPVLIFFGLATYSAIALTNDKPKERPR